MRYFIYPYKYASKGAKALAKALGGKRVKEYTWVPGSNDLVINWGNGGINIPRAPGVGIALWSPLNDPVDVALIANKRKAFQLFAEQGVPIPRFATHRDGVTWEGKTVVRHKLTGHSGEGIQIVKDKVDLPLAPLYVEYIKKQEEYRVHIGSKEEGTSIIAVQRKARRLETPDDEVDWQVRNHSNGFVFVRNNVDPPPPVLDAASQAIVASGLDFGAVDIVWNEQRGVAYVLEINTAPGLEGQTIEDYAAFFKTQIDVG